jgi:hypothetical protein
MLEHAGENNSKFKLAMWLILGYPSPRFNTNLNSFTVCQ